MLSISWCLQQLENNLTESNYLDLTDLIKQQHKLYNYNTPQNAIFALLGNIVGEKYFGINDYLRQHTYEDALELLQRAQNY